MESTLTALKLMMDELGLSPDDTSLQGRMRLQGTVYLANAIAGLGSSYRFEWNLGPYSPHLADHFHALSGHGDRETGNVELQEHVREKLRTLAPKLAVPEDVRLSQSDWVMLLAAVHYLRHRRGVTTDGNLRRILSRDRPAVVDYQRRAITRLDEIAQ